MKKNDIKEMEMWLYSFMIYLISAKANIIKIEEQRIGFSDQEIKSIYPMYDEYYMLDSAKEWILYGLWNEELVEFEVENVKKRENASSPKEIVKANCILDIDEDVIIKGFPEVLIEAYSGLLDLNEYIVFICNSYYVRKYKFDCLTAIEWKKVKNGVNNSINRILCNAIEGELIYRSIAPELKRELTEEELSVYIVIEEFKNSDKLLYNRNKARYIESMRKNPVKTFQDWQCWVINVFDKEMADVTYNAYEKADNSVKRRFGSTFCDLINKNMYNYKIDYKETYEGLSQLVKMLEHYKEKLNNTNKRFANEFTKDFITSLEEIINKLEEYVD